MKNVLSVQSSVVYGYAGNKAAVLPMQLLGDRCLAVLHRTVFQPHPIWDVAGHGDAARRAERDHQRVG